MSRSSVLLATAAALTLIATVSACTPEGAATPTPTVEPTYAATGDGVLRIGSLFPTTGQSAFIGAAQVAGVETAVREINLAGGVNGVPVEVFHRNSADATTQTAEASFADLVAKGVDVVIGPSSSVLAERLLAPAVAAGIPLISPAATFPSLTDADDSGFLFRTIGSYGDQGAALGTLLTADTAAKVAVVASDDETGAALTDSLTASVEDGGGTVVASEAVAGNVTAAVAAVAKAKPDVVVLALPAESVEQSKALITQLSAAGLGGAKLWLTSGNLADYSQALPAGLLAGVNGILEGAQPDATFTARLLQADPGLTDFRYAAEAYDATILAALAAIEGDDDGGPSISRELATAASGGVKCTSFGECLAALDTEDDVDYDGISGSLSLTAAGDVSDGQFSVFTYGADNKYVFAKVVTAGS